MRIEQLREFIAIYETRSFTQAAKRLFLTQSVISRHLASMEKELGARLFMRDQHHVEPTAKGTAFYNEIKPLIKKYDRALVILGSAGEARQQLHISYLAGACAPFLRKACREFAKAYPDTELLLHSVEYNESYEELDNGTDLLFSFLARPFTDKGFLSEIIYDDSYCICVSEDHPFAKRSKVTFQDLAEVPFKALNYDPNSMLSRDLAEEFAKAGIGKPKVLSVADLNSIPISAAPRTKDDCILMVSDLKEFFDDDAVFVPLDSNLVVHVSAVWKQQDDCEEIRFLVRMAKEKM